MSNGRLDKIANAIKATGIVLCVCCAGLAAVLFYGLCRTASDLALMLICITVPFVVLGLAIYVVYRYLEAR